MQHGRWGVWVESRQNRLYKMHCSAKKTKRCAKRYGVPWKNSKQLSEPTACQKHKETRKIAPLAKNIITSILPGPRQPSVARLDENEPTCCLPVLLPLARAENR